MPAAVQRSTISPSFQWVATTPVDVLLGEYRTYLEDERGLAAGTVWGANTRPSL
jgi:hypothetical protein